MQNCRQDLAAAIQADVKTVIENYVKNQDTGISAEHKSQYQELAYTAVNQQLRDAAVIFHLSFHGFSVTSVRPLFLFSHSDFTIP